MRLNKATGGCDMLIFNPSDVVAVLGQMGPSDDGILAIDNSASVSIVHRVTRQNGFASNAAKIYIWMEPIKSPPTPLQALLLGRGCSLRELETTTGTEAVYVRDALNALRSEKPVLEGLHPVARAVYESLVAKKEALT